jgi:hypothetical protein
MGASNADGKHEAKEVTAFNAQAWRGSASAFPLFPHPAKYPFSIVSEWALLTGIW